LSKVYAILIMDALRDEAPHIRTHDDRKLTTVGE
jgi:hypothetical protein